MGRRARGSWGSMAQMGDNDEKPEILGAALMVFLTPTRGQAMVHRISDIIIFIF
jgi:hypothetical protein